MPESFLAVQTAADGNRVLINREFDQDGYNR